MDKPVPGYLASLTIRLSAGVERIAEGVRGRHTDYFRSAQRPDGGFAGRLGESDPYYTSFALRDWRFWANCLATCAERAAAFLRSRMTGHESLIDQMSLVFGAVQIEAAAGMDVFGPEGGLWKDRLAGRLNALRRDDGGFAKGAGGTASSTYHTFLTLLCLQAIDRPIADPDRVVRFVLSQGDPWGGFREIRVSKRAGTNPTAAGIGTLQLLDALRPDVQAATADFLAEMQDRDGGLVAGSRVPISDLLSTFTGILTLAELGADQAIDRPAALRFVRGIDLPEGGFRAAPWDEGSDVEYTFYGLGALALLASVEA